MGGSVCFGIGGSVCFGMGGVYFGIFTDKICRIHNNGFGTVCVAFFRRSIEIINKIFLQLFFMFRLCGFGIAI
jgi:hypothetical protein